MAISSKDMAFGKNNIQYDCKYHDSHKTWRHDDVITLVTGGVPIEKNPVILSLAVFLLSV